MKIAFNKEGDFTQTKVKKFHDSIKENKKSAVVLHHSEYCGHCVAMRDEFDKFKKSTDKHVIEVEGGALGTLKKHNHVYKRVCPSDGSMYFPMIVIFIKRTYYLTPKKYIYEGDRTAEGIHKFIKEKEEKHKKNPIKKLLKGKKLKVHKKKMN